MIQVVFTLSSHTIFIYFAFHLLSSLVKWEQFLKVSADNSRKIHLFILLLSVGLGYLLSSFFISIYMLARDAFLGNL